MLMPNQFSVFPQKPSRSRRPVGVRRAGARAAVVEVVEGQLLWREEPRVRQL
jgi:hypothetical protein